MRWTSCKILARMALGLLFVTPVLADSFHGLTEPYEITETRDTIIRPDGSSFDVLLYYPSNSAIGPIPVVIFGHGFLCPPELYQSILRDVASHGYVVIAPRSFLERFPDHLAYSRDLIHCANWISETPPPDLLSRVFTSAFCVAGHSMGGGAALLAAADDDRFLAVATMAAAETRPSAIEACARISRQIMFITGSDDTFVPNVSNTRLMFELAPRPSYWFDIKGGSHCGFIRASLPDSVCDEGRISRFEQTSISARLLVDFFDLAFKIQDSGWKGIVGPQSDFDRRLTVRRKNLATLSPDRKVLPVSRGGANSYIVTLTNHSGFAHAFSIEATNRTGSVTVSPSYFPQVPAFGGSVTATVTVAVGSQTKMKRDTILLRAYPPGAFDLGGDYSWGLIRVGR